MPLDPRLRPVLEQAGLLKTPGPPPAAEVLLAEQRAGLPDTPNPDNERLQPVARVDELRIPGPAGVVAARLYTPEGDGPFGLLAYLHGGGWVAGGLESHDLGCRRICREGGCLVLAVEYHLPPEHTFPAGLEDCYAALCWIAEHAPEHNGDPAHLAVGGDSGGGNFAAALALMARDRGGPPLAFQLLLVPVLDFDVGAPSWREYDGYLATREEFLVARDLYLVYPEQQTQSYAAPALAPDLRGLPPALILTAECDPMRDSGERYGRRLQQAGVPVTISRYPGMVHAFMALGAVVPEAANGAFAEVAQTLRSVL
jgi:acetyl esterase